MFFKCGVFGPQDAFRTSTYSSSRTSFSSELDLPSESDTWNVILDLSFHCVHHKIDGILWEFWGRNGTTAISGTCQFSVLLAPVRRWYGRFQHFRVGKLMEGFVGGLPGGYERCQRGSQRTCCLAALARGRSSCDVHHQQEHVGFAAIVSVVKHGKVMFSIPSGRCIPSREFDLLARGKETVAFRGKAVSPEVREPRLPNFFLNLLNF